ncbi:MAG: hypothetical protein ABEL76_00775 [Bradymonadaceae bacterium]
MTEETLELQEKPRESPPDPEEPSTFEVFAHYGVTALVVALALGIATWSYLEQNYPTSVRPGVDMPRQAFDSAIGRARADRLEHALEVYRLDRDGYPPALDELVRAELVRQRDLFYRPGGERFDYRRRPDGFELRPPSGTKPAD